MKQVHNNTKWKQITYENRQKIEILLKIGKTTREIAKLIGCSKRTIERERKRGEVITYKTEHDPIAIDCHLPRKYREVKEYSADVSQKLRQEAGTRKGRNLKIANDYALADYLEQKIGVEKYSPYAALADIENEKREFATKICVKTVYNYLDKDIFYTITNNNLWEKRKRKRRGYKQVRKAYNNQSGTSISERPPDIDKREDIGHWEMDTVVGKGKVALLVLSERKSRYEIIRKIKGKTQEAVLNALGRLEKEIGVKNFRKTYKTITCDNGGEFLDKSMENSKSGKKRTKIYYAHPYSAWERGTNENINRMIRRFIPKGANIDEWNEKDIARIERMINNYPRKILGGLSAKTVLTNELCINTKLFLKSATI